MLRRVSWIPIVLLCAGLTTPAVADPTLELVNASQSNCDLQIAIRLTDVDSIYTSFHVTVNYDDTKLDFIDAELGPAAIAEGYAAGDLDANDVAGTLGFPISSPSPFNRHVIVQLVDQSPGTLADITGTDQDVIYLNFTALQPNTTTTLVFDTTDEQDRHPTFLTTTSPSLHDITADDILFDVDLEVTVDPLTLFGCALYAVNDNEINNVEVTGIQGMTTVSEDTGDDGIDCEYSLDGFVNGAVTVTATRNTDIDDEDAISGGDANRMWQFVAMAPAPNATQIRIGDVVFPTDDAIMANDAIAVSKWLIFLENSANHTGDWSFDLDDGTNPIGRETLTTAFSACDSLEVAITGYFLGDVDFTWPLRNNKSSTTPVGFALETVRHDDEVLEIRMTGDVRSQALEDLVYSLRYDATQWTYEVTQLDSRIAGFVAMDNPAESGVVHGLVLGAGQHMTESGAIATFRFRARNPEAAGRFEFSRLVANDQKSNAMPVLDLGGNPPITAAPRAFALTSAPNPFNPTSRIEYVVADEGIVPVTLRVYDLAGHLVRTLVEATQSPGTYQSIWNGKDEAGRTVGAGVYLVQMRAGAWTQVHKTALVK